MRHRALSVALVGRCLGVSCAALASCRDDAVDAVEATAGSSEDTGDVDLVDWNELVFARRSESDASLMTVSRDGSGLGVIQHLPELASWVGVSGDGRVMAWTEASDAMELRVLREDDPEPQSIPHVQTARAWSPVGSRIVLGLVEPEMTPRIVVRDFDGGADVELPTADFPLYLRWSRTKAT